MRRLAFVLSAACLLSCFPLTCHFGPRLTEAVLGPQAPAPDPAALRKQDVLREYGREMDAIFERHGRVMTPECEREQEELRRAVRAKLEALRREGR
jgi:hypothetical protein